MGVYASLRYTCGGYIVNTAKLGNSNTETMPGGSAGVQSRQLIPIMIDRVQPRVQRRTK